MSEIEEKILTYLKENNKQFFSSSIGKMIPFAMTASFISAPVFAYLNYSLSKQYEKPKWLTFLALLGLVYLASMVVVYFIFF